MEYSDIKNILEKPSEQRSEAECELLAKACSGELFSDGSTVLGNASFNRDTKMALELIDAGSDINAIDTNGNTALIYASLIGDTMVISALIAKDAVIDTKNKCDQTALMYAASNGHTGTALALLDKGAHVNATDKNGYTALIYAASQCHTDTALALIDKGADINAKDNFDQTALMHAASKCHSDTVSALIAAHLVKKIQPQFQEVESLLAKDTSIHSMKELHVKGKKEIDALYDALHSSLDHVKLLPRNHIDSNLIALKVIEQLQLQALPKSHILIQLIDSIVKTLYQLFLTLTLDNKRHEKIILFRTQRSLNKALDAKAKQQPHSQTAQ